MGKRVFSLLTAMILIIIFAASCGSRDADRREDFASAVVDAEPAPTLVPEITPSPVPTPEPEEPEPVAEIIPITLQDALTRANERREGVIKPDYNELLLMIEEYTLNLENILRFIEPRQRVDTVLLNTAIADVEDFFELLRDTYGGYVVLGGDAVFLPIRDAIIEEITTFGAGLGTTTLARILREHLLEVIADAHFILDGHRFERDVFFYVSTVAFDRTVSGFRNRETGLYAVMVDETPMEYAVQLSLDEYGAFYYSLVIVRDYGLLYITSTILYTCGTIEEIRLNRLQAATRIGFQPTSLEFINGVPIVTKRSMTFESNAQIHMTNTFLSFAEEVQDEPVVIVDLRSNGGGNGVLPYMWLYALTGEYIPSNNLSLGVNLFAGDLFHSTPANNIFYQSEENIQRFIPRKGLSDYFILMGGDPPDRIIEREQLLIVLTDRHTASAAEAFVDLAMNISNTLIIGTNTGGVLNFSGSGFNTSMLRSGIPFSFGPSAFIWPEGYLPESVGITPDIWVTGDALAAALAMLRADI